MRQADDKSVTYPERWVSGRSPDATQLRRFWLWMLLLTGVAAALRLWQLDFQSYWYDELFSAHVSAPDNSLRAVVSQTVADVHPPLYQVLLWAAYKLFGYTEWVGRLPSVVAGVFTVVGVALLGRRLYGLYIGAFAAALASLNYYLVYFSQEARSYALLVCLFVFSMHCFVALLQENSRRWLFAYVLVTLSLFYTHYFGLLVLPVQGAALMFWFAVHRRLDTRLLRQALLALMLLAVGILPLISVIISHATLSQFWIWQPSLWVFVNYVHTYFASTVLAVFIVLFVIVALAYSLRDAIKIGPQRGNAFAALLLITWIVIGYMLPWLWGKFNQPVLTDRNTIMLVPPILLLAASGWWRLKGLWLRRIIAGFLLLFAVYQLLIGTQYYSAPIKHQYREVVQKIREFKPSTYVYALQDNSTKFNVYFRQLGYPWLAGDGQQLSSDLQSGQAPSLLWVVDGHLQRLTSDVMEQYELKELGRYRYREVVAVLYIDPSAAVTADPGDLSAGASCASEHRVRLPAAEVDGWLVYFGPSESCEAVTEFNIISTRTGTEGAKLFVQAGPVPTVVPADNAEVLPVEWIIRTHTPSAVPVVWGVTTSRNQHQIR